MTLPYKQYPDGRQVCRSNAVGMREYHYRTNEMTERQKNCCGICWCALGRPTFDHQSGRGMGGGLRDDRILIDGLWVNSALCLGCNMLKGSRRFHWVGKLYLPVAYQILAEARVAGEKLLPPLEVPPWSSANCSSWLQ